jgi:hypothetical protein
MRTGKVLGEFGPLSCDLFFRKNENMVSLSRPDQNNSIPGLRFPKKQAANGVAAL